MTEIYDFHVRTNRGDAVSLADYRDTAMLIVNTASRCGFTPHYAGLEALYRAFKDRGLVVLGFPCNQFGAQEPGDAAEIARFCALTYDVTFPLFEKIDVNGRTAHPLFAWLTAQAPGLLGSRAIKWNFTKFLVDRAGQVVGRFAPATKPEALRPKIEALLLPGQKPAAALPTAVRSTEVEPLCSGGGRSAGRRRSPFSSAPAFAGARALIRTGWITR